MPGKNPYRPGAATVPRYLAGREPQVARFRKILHGAPEIPANLRLIGLRGVGKSVLLKELETVAKAENWATVRQQLEPRHNSEREFAQLLTALSQAAKERVSRMQALRAKGRELVSAGRRMLQVSIEDVTFSLAGDHRNEVELAEALFDAVQASLEAGQEGFALLLDEAQVIRDDKAREGEHPLSMLVAAVNALQELEVPIALVMCGLPTLRANLQRARTYSERMFRGEKIAELAGNPGPARDAFVKPLDESGIVAEEDLIARVLEEVEGYPFFIQLWGAELWDAAIDVGLDRLTVELLETIEPQIYERLDEEFYAGRVETLTPSEQDLLMTTAHCPSPPLRTIDIQNASEKSAGNINVIMGRLAEQGVVYRIQKGQYEYTAPKFGEYLRRRVAGLRTG